MGWIEDKSAWLGCPYFADLFEGCGALKGLQTPSLTVCVDEVGGQLGMSVVMVAFDGRLFDGAVHPLDLADDPGMLDLGEPVLDPIFDAAHVEHLGHIGGRGAIGVARRKGELDTIARCGSLWHRLDQCDQEG